jgi:hypothetical protein
MPPAQPTPPPPVQPSLPDFHPASPTSQAAAPAIEAAPPVFRAAQITLHPARRDMIAQTEFKERAGAVPLERPGTQPAFENGRPTSPQARSLATGSGRHNAPTAPSRPKTHFDDRLDAAASADAAIQQDLAPPPQAPGTRSQPQVTHWPNQPSSASQQSYRPSRAAPAPLEQPPRIARASPPPAPPARPAPSARPAPAKLASQQAPSPARPSPTQNQVQKTKEHSPLAVKRAAVPPMPVAPPQPAFARDPPPHPPATWANGVAVADSLKEEKPRTVATTFGVLSAPRSVADGFMKSAFQTVPADGAEGRFHPAAEELTAAPQATLPARPTGLGSFPLPSKPEQRLAPASTAPAPSASSEPPLSARPSASHPLIPPRIPSPPMAPAPRPASRGPPPSSSLLSRVEAGGSGMSPGPVSRSSPPPPAPQSALSARITSAAPANARPLPPPPPAPLPISDVPSGAQIDALLAALGTSASPSPALPTGAPAAEPTVNTLKRPRESQLAPAAVQWTGSGGLLSRITAEEFAPSSLLERITGGQGPLSPHHPAPPSPPPPPPAPAPVIAASTSLLGRIDGGPLPPQKADGPGYGSREPSPQGAGGSLAKRLKLDNGPSDADLERERAMRRNVELEKSVSAPASATPVGHED